MMSLHDVPTSDSTLNNDWCRSEVGHLAVLISSIGPWGCARDGGSPRQNGIVVWEGTRFPCSPNKHTTHQVSTREI